jgi:hypothetical protein
MDRRIGYPVLSPVERGTGSIAQWAPADRGTRGEAMPTTTELSGWKPRAPDAPAFGAAAKGW